MGIGIGISPAFSSAAIGGGSVSAPDAPTGLTVTAVSASQIDLAWNASTGATGYKIERGTNGVDFVLIDTVGEVVAYEDTGLSGGTYYYRILATNVAGDSDYSNIANTTIYDWYVDSVNGDDGNAGTSEAQAFVTIGQLTTAGFAAGEWIGLAKGSVWREQLTISVNNVTIEAYGTGNRPQLDASDVVAAGDWSKTGGLTNVYEAVVSADLAASKTWVNVWEDSANLVRVANTATCDATPGSYVPSADTGSPGNITIYIHPVGSTNPTTDGKTYTVTARKYGLLCTGSGLSVTGIETRCNLYEDGSLVVGRSALLTDIICRSGSKHNVYVQDGCVLDNVQCLGSYYTTSSNLFAYNENSPAGLGIAFNNCHADPNPGTATISTTTVGYAGHINTSGDFGTITYNDCTATNCNFGFGGTGGATYAYNRCSGVGCTNAFRPTDPSKTYTFTDCTHVDAADITNRVWSVEANGITLVIRGGVVSIVNSNDSTAVIYSGAGSGMSFDIQNSSFTTTAASGAGRMLVNGSGQMDVYARNNEYIGANFMWIYLLSNALSTLDSDLNSFSRDTLNFNIAGTTYGSVATFQTGTGQDENSTVG